MKARILVVLPLLWQLAGTAHAAAEWADLVSVDGVFSNLEITEPSAPGGTYEWSVTTASESWWESWFQTTYGASVTNVRLMGFGIWEPDSSITPKAGTTSSSTPWSASADGAPVAVIWERSGLESYLNAGDSAWFRSGFEKQIGHGPGATTVGALLTDPTRVGIHLAWDGDEVNWNGTGLARSGWTKAPEPASLVLLGCAAGAGAWVRKRRTNKTK